MALRLIPIKGPDAQYDSVKAVITDRKFVSIGTGHGVPGRRDSQLGAQAAACEAIKEATEKKRRVRREELYLGINEGQNGGLIFRAMTIPSSVVRPALFLLLLMSLCGCTTGLAMQGLSSGAPVAFNASGSGKGDSAWFALYDDVVQATLRAGEKLSFHVRKKNIGKDNSAFTFVDDQGAKLKIMIDRRTETLTRVRFNVGLFGSESIGRLMARQIIVEVAEAEDFLRDWHPTEDN